MPKTSLNELVTYDRSLRIEVTHAAGQDPSLIGCSAWETDDDGQWRHLSSWTYEPFDPTAEHAPMLLLLQQWVKDLVAS